LLPPQPCAENDDVVEAALLRNWSRCVRKLVRLGVGRRPQLQQLALLLFRRFSFRSVVVVGV